MLELDQLAGNTSSLSRESTSPFCVQQCIMGDAHNTRGGVVARRDTAEINENYLYHLLNYPLIVFLFTSTPTSTVM